MKLGFWIPSLRLAAIALFPYTVGAAPFVYVGGTDHLTVLDSATNAIVSTIPIGGICLVGIAVNGNGTRVYVGCPFSFKVSVVDTGSNTVVASVPLGNGADGIAVNDAGTRAYAAIPSSNVVSVIDTATDSVITNVAVGANPDGLAVNPSGSRVYVANLHSNSVSVIDTTSNTVVETIAVGSFPIAVAVNRAGTRAFVTNSQSNSVSVIDTATNTIVATVPVGSAPSGVAGPTGVAVNPAGTRVYVVDSHGNNVSVIDTSTNAVVATVAVGANPLGVALNPTGTRAYVPSADSHNVSVIDTASNLVIATVAGGIGCCIAFGQFIMPAAETANNYQGLWWASGGTESGWGINFAHQADQVFATWYTYDTTGKAWWLSMLASRTTPASTTYTGTIYVDSGPPFNDFVGMGVPSALGNGTLTFGDVNNGSFTYTVNTTMPPTTQTKAITRFDLGTGPQPTCIYSSTTPNFSAATNYQDLWWVPNGAESGWGVSFAHQGNSIFATWYTYNVLGGTPLWLSALAQRQGTTDVYVGPIYQDSGPRFDAYDTTKVVANPVGTATFTFGDGNNATFGYTVMVAPLPGPVTQAKQLTRFQFAATAGTVCQ